MNENKSSEQAAEQSTNTENNKVDTSANSGGGKDGRKSNPDRVESAKEKETRLRAELATLQSTQDRYPGIQKDIAKLKNQIKQAVEKQKKSESHGRKGKRN